MAYATQDDLVPLRMSQKDLNELTIDDPDVDPTSDAGKKIVASITGKALDEASGRIESYCRARYVTPLQASEDVKSLTLDIAIYILFTRRRETPTNETAQERYSQAIAFLKDIATSKASLDQPASSSATQSSIAGPELSDKDRNLRFSDSQIEGFV